MNSLCIKSQSQSTGKWASPTVVSLTAHNVSCTFYELANIYGLNTKFRTSLSVPENWVALPVRVVLVATYSYQCVQCFCVAKQRYGCQCLGFLRCAQMSLLMHSVHQESALEVDSGRKIPCCTRDSNCNSIMLGFSVKCSPNWAILPFQGSVGRAIV